MSIESVKAFVATHAPIYTSAIHGIAHWDRVWEFGQSIGWAEDADLEVVQYFAYLHDCQRWDDGKDLEHGPRAARFTREVRELIDLSADQFHLLVRAISGHTFAMPGSRAGEDPTLATCWDADRLDIGRVGIHVDPKYLFTDMAKELCALGNSQG